MKYAWLKGYSYVVQFDGDGQHRPEYIKSMKEKMDEGYDIVIGSRFVTEKKSWSMRMLGSRSDRNGDLADYRSKDQRSYLRHASFQQEDDGGICPEFKLRTGARYRILPYPSGSKDRRSAGYY